MPKDNQPTPPRTTWWVSVRRCLEDLFARVERLEAAALKDPPSTPPGDKDAS
jgi:hypothetical protein